MTPRPPPRGNGGARVATLPRLIVNVVGAGLWLTGAFWLVSHYLLKRQGWLRTLHPPQTRWVRFHAPLAVRAIWMFGFFWGTHVVPGWWTRRRARSGVALVTVAGWLMLSAYLLYYLGDEDQRFVVSILHWSVGLSCPVLFLAHRWRARAHPPGH